MHSPLLTTTQICLKNNINIKKLRESNKQMNNVGV